MQIIGFSLKRYRTAAFIFSMILSIVPFGFTDDSSRQSTAYAGHDHDKDKDIKSLISIYPSLIGTPLDDCRLCHGAGTVDGRTVNSCDYCHQVYKKEGIAITLNPFGKSYLQAGRNADAYTKIAPEDSDGDGVSNELEINALSYPGDSGSIPNLPDCPIRILTPEALSKIPETEQFLLLNTTRHEDSYSTYRGWKVTDILAAASVKLESVERITVISWDGFRKDFSREEILMEYPKGIFYTSINAQTAERGCQEWVEYPDPIPDRIKAESEIPDKLHLLMASARNGTPLIPLQRNESGKLRGEGPYRLIIPQKTPAPPDQPSTKNDVNCPFPYTESIHHNSGDSPRGVIAIVVHPLPDGTKEPDWRKMADDLLSHHRLLICGAVSNEQ